MKNLFGELQIKYYVSYALIRELLCVFPCNFCLPQRIIWILKSSYLDSTIIQIKKHYLNSAAFKISRLYKKFYLIALITLTKSVCAHFWLTELQML